MSGRILLRIVPHTLFEQEDADDDGAANIQDLLVDPSTRGVSDIIHKITAIGSRSPASAQKFIDILTNGNDTPDYKWSWGLSNGRLEAKAYGSEADVFADSVSETSCQFYPPLPFPQLLPH